MDSSISGNKVMKDAEDMNSNKNNLGKKLIMGKKDIQEWFDSQLDNIGGGLKKQLVAAFWLVKKGHRLDDLVEKVFDPKVDDKVKKVIVVGIMNRGDDALVNMLEEAKTNEGVSDGV